MRTTECLLATSPDIYFLLDLKIFHIFRTLDDNEWAHQNSEIKCAVCWALIRKFSVLTNLSSGTTNLRVHAVVMQFALSSWRFVYTYPAFHCHIVVIFLSSKYIFGSLLCSVAGTSSRGSGPIVTGVNLQCTRDYSSSAGSERLMLIKRWASCLSIWL
jgi:hypothetical protein